MAEDDSRAALLTALTTDHFALQAIASSTISEAGSRSSLYLLSLSSGLIALGFSTGTEGTFVVFAGTILPVIFLLGWFTVARLVDTSVENVRVQGSITKIREYYGTLTPDAGEFFPTPGNVIENERVSAEARRRSRFWVLGTMATMVGIVNSVLGGVAVALVVEVGMGTSRIASVAIGLVVIVVLVTSMLLYQRARFRAAFPPETR